MPGFRREEYLYQTGKAQHGHGFSILRLVAAHDRIRKCRLSAETSRRQRRRSGEKSRGSAGPDGAVEVGGSTRAGAQRRTTAAGGAGASIGFFAESLAAR